MATRGVMLLAFQVLLLCFLAQAWNTERGSFELESQRESLKNVHLVTDCMHVTSEEGEYSFVKLPPTRTISKQPWLNSLEGSPQQPNGAPDVATESSAAPATVCGIYFVADPDQVIEVTMRQMNVECATGGLMAFVDGWELNGQYFPGEWEHEKRLDLRVQEFCVEPGAEPWPAKSSSNAWVFRSSQNAALIQYRVPVRGSFVLSARFLHNARPCNIMAEGLAPYYMLRNYGQRRNCTLTALFPAVVSVVALETGPIDGMVRYVCSLPTDKLEIGGSAGLDPHNMLKATTLCGHSGGRMDLEQSILCGTTSVRLISSGHYNNQAMVTMRLAEDADLRLTTIMCEM
ncbi:corticotropin-releasing factor-binding protein [Anopheles bellator]|uniref:corticotropin-releasing factor-binding protein n=1 Tax=Anopheles bellator TaxID=139047 RepID=UPI002647B4C6|nr:corticotropin-releasing factor-binding protein [Anopheles bellator]